MNQTRLCPLGAPIWGQGKQQRRSRATEGLRQPLGLAQEGSLQAGSSPGRLSRGCEIGWGEGQKVGLVFSVQS